MKTALQFIWREIQASSRYPKSSRVVMSYQKLIVLFLLVWSVEGHRTNDPLISTKGIIYRIYLMVDKKIKEEYNISIRDIRQIFEGASRITSSQLNIHLQILDYKRIELYYWYFPDPITLLEVMQSKAEEMYDKWVHFDHFILLHTNNFTSGTLTPYQPIFLENNACSKHSIGLLNIRDGDTRDKQVKVLPKDNLSRLIAKDVMWSVFRTFYSQSRCKCDDSSICLTEDVHHSYTFPNSAISNRSI